MKIDSALSMTAIPATLDFGHGLQNTTLTAAPVSIIINSSSPWTLTAAASNWTGPQLLSPTNHEAYRVNGGAAVFFAGPMEVATLATGTTSAPTSVVLSMETKDHTPGIYTGSVVWTASN